MSDPDSAKPSVKEEPAIIEYAIDATDGTSTCPKLNATDNESILLQGEGKSELNEINYTIGRRGDPMSRNFWQRRNVVRLGSSVSNVRRSTASNPISFAIDRRENPIGAVKSVLSNTKPTTSYPSRTGDSGNNLVESINSMALQLESVGINSATVSTIEDIITEQISKVTMSDSITTGRAGPSRVGACIGLGPIVSLTILSPPRCGLCDSRAFEGIYQWCNHICSPGHHEKYFLFLATPFDEEAYIRCWTCCVDIERRSWDDHIASDSHKLLQVFRATDPSFSSKIMSSDPTPFNHAVHRKVTKNLWAKDNEDDNLAIFTSSILGKRLFCDDKAPSARKSQLETTGVSLLEFHLTDNSKRQRRLHFNMSCMRCIFTAPSDPSILLHHMDSFKHKLNVRKWSLRYVPQDVKRCSICCKDGLVNNWKCHVESNFHQMLAKLCPDQTTSERLSLSNVKTDAMPVGKGFLTEREFQASCYSCRECGVVVSGDARKHRNTESHMNAVASIPPTVFCAVCRVSVLSEDWNVHASDLKHPPVRNPTARCHVCTCLVRITSWESHTMKKGHISTLLNLSKQGMTVRKCEVCTLWMLPSHWNAHLKSKLHKDRTMAVREGRVQVYSNGNSSMQRYNWHN